MRKDNLITPKTNVISFSRNKKEEPKRRSPKQKQKLQKMIADIKEKSGCVDCLQKYPYYVLDFDHTYGKKVANISSMLDSYSVEDIVKEIKKCDIVCANCHRERTFQRRNALKDVN